MGGHLSVSEEIHRFHCQFPALRPDLVKILRQEVVNPGVLWIQGELFDFVQVDQVLDLFQNVPCILEGASP